MHAAAAIFFLIVLLCQGKLTHGYGEVLFVRCFDPIGAFEVSLVVS